MPSTTIASAMPALKYQLVFPRFSSSCLAFALRRPLLPRCLFWILVAASPWRFFSFASSRPFLPRCAD
jgi:hypothetical protein